MKRNWHGQEFRKLVMLGESTTAGGWASSPERCWVSRLAALIDDVQAQPAELVNSGIGANVISTRSPVYESSGKPAATERLHKHVIAHAPDLLIISYGLNDCRGGTPLDLFAQEMVRIIEEVRAACDPLIVLAGPYLMTDFELGAPEFGHGSLAMFHAYNDRIRQVAKAEDCLFVDLIAAYDDAEWMVHKDGCHANDLGHLVVANEIFKVLAQNCSGLANHTKEMEDQIPPWRDESTLSADYGYELGQPSPH